VKYGTASSKHYIMPEFNVSKLKQPFLKHDMVSTANNENAPLSPQQHINKHVHQKPYLVLITIHQTASTGNHRNITYNHFSNFTMQLNIATSSSAVDSTKIVYAKAIVKLTEYHTSYTTDLTISH